MQNTKKCLTSFFHSLWGRLKSFETYLLISRSNFAKKTWFVVWRVSSIRSFVDYYPRDANINREYWVAYQIDSGLINTIDTRVTGFDSKGAQRISFPVIYNRACFPRLSKTKQNRTWPGIEETTLAIAKTINPIGERKVVDRGRDLRDRGRSPRRQSPSKKNWPPRWHGLNLPAIGNAARLCSAINRYG